jgi:hypothetical protein
MHTTRWSSEAINTGKPISLNNLGLLRLASTLRKESCNEHVRAKFLLAWNFDGDRVHLLVYGNEKEYHNFQVRQPSSSFKYLKTYVI